MRLCPLKRFLFAAEKRSMTMALRSAAFRPHERAALRLITSGSAVYGDTLRIGNTTLLP